MYFKYNMNHNIIACQWDITKPYPRENWTPGITRAMWSVRAPCSTCTSSDRRLKQHWRVLILFSRSSRWIALTMFVTCAFNWLTGLKRNTITTILISLNLSICTVLTFSLNSVLLYDKHSMLLFHSTFYILISYLSLFRCLLYSRFLKLSFYLYRFSSMYHTPVFCCSLQRFITFVLLKIIQHFYPSL